MVFKILFASNQSIISSLYTCISLSSLLWMFTSQPLIANSIQSWISDIFLPILWAHTLYLHQTFSQLHTVSNFLVSISISSNSYFIHLVNAADYLCTDHAQVFYSWIKSLTFNFDFKTSVSCPKFSSDILDSSVKTLLASNIPRYL